MSYALFLAITLLLTHYATPRLVRRLPAPRRPVRSRLARLRRVELRLSA